MYRAIRIVRIGRTAQSRDFVRYSSMEYSLFFLVVVILCLVWLEHAQSRTNNFG